MDDFDKLTLKSVIICITNFSYELYLCLHRVDKMIWPNKNTLFQTLLAQPYVSIAEFSTLITLTFPITAHPKKLVMMCLS